MHILRQLVVVPLIVCLLLPADALAQQILLSPQARPTPGQVKPRSLSVVPLEGEGAVNFIPLRTATAPVVEVRDENDKPVEGATVVFKLPSSGPSGYFPGQEQTQTTVTDYRGQAGARGYMMNDQPGKFVIDITATYQDRVGQLLMTQTNSVDRVAPEATKRGGKGKWITLLILGGAGAGAAAYFGLRDNSSPLSISPGPVVITAP